MMIHDILAFLAEENRRNQAGEAPQVTAESLKLITDVLGLGEHQAEARLHHTVGEDESKPQRRKLVQSCGGASSQEITTIGPTTVPEVESRTCDSNHTSVRFIC